MRDKKCTKVGKRETFSIRIKPEVMKAYRALCSKHGFSIGRRIEKAMLIDIERFKVYDRK